MAEVKLTKTELRLQQNRLLQLQKYLPTLQLKKALLQLEIQEARFEIEESKVHQQRVWQEIENYAPLLSDDTLFDWNELTLPVEIGIRYENIAGIEVPYFEKATFAPATYDLFETPPWVDQAVIDLRRLREANLRLQISREKCQALERELREVAIRVNLFEKILIPRAQTNIKKIKIFLGDMQLTAVSQAKVAKRKIQCASM